MSTNPTAPLTFKIASQPDEFEQIHRLNYKTFVEEIPQHEPNAHQTLVDRFDAQNIYLVCLRGAKLCGMMALRERRPFSLDFKIPDLDAHLPPARSMCELRLLAVAREHRNGSVFRGLCALLARHCRDKGHDLALISGTTRQQKLYRHLGFVPFGPLVGTPEALFQPMYLTAGAFAGTEKRLRPLVSRTSLEDAPTMNLPATNAPATPAQPISFLPGPVNIACEVRRVLGQAPISHRSPQFVDAFGNTQKLLCTLANAAHVQIFLGSGTLANDVVATQLSVDSLSLGSRRGLILCNGEFGLRLQDHARRFGLRFEVLEADWGQPFDAAQVERVARSASPDWLWAVHCETSTGVLNDMAMLKEICRRTKARLCLDCISSLGATPLDLRGVHLASAASGKGLGAFAGLSMVFHNHPVAPSQTLPRYLDLGLHAAQEGSPFTASSNLLLALQQALQGTQWPRRFERNAQLSRWLRERLRELGFQLVAAEAHASPAVTTFALPPHPRSVEVGRRLEEAGYLLSFRSEYLLARNWMQICTMGECSHENAAALLSALHTVCSFD